MDNQEEQNNYDENGNLFIKLTVDDSALVVRSNGTIELVSHDLENSEDGYVGDIEDLSKTFSLVLALASALENEELYHRIYHNLNKVLMKKWESLSAETKQHIIKLRQEDADNRTHEEDQDKKKRVDDFRNRMSQYKKEFLDNMESENDKLRKDMKDEEGFLGRNKDMFSDPYGPPGPEFPDPSAINMPEKKRKVRKPSLRHLRNVNWNPYDKSLKAHFKDYRPDEPPDLEDDE
jgi:hypothetical protein